MHTLFARPRSRPLSVLRAAGVAAVVLATLGHNPPPAAAADPAKGDVPVVAPRMTRQELIRKWDLNSDGKIDVGEADVASSRMRLERAEMRLNSGVDPVTGRPRGEAPPEEPQPEEPLVDIFGNPLDTDPADLLRPRKESEGAAGRKPEPFGGLRGGKSGATRQPAGASSMSRPAGPLTGGVRAGAQAARPGYGTASPPELNAGRPRGAVPYRDMQVPGTAPRGSLGAAPRGGLLPRLGAPRPTPVTPGPPRRTVEDYEVY